MRGASGGWLLVAAFVAFGCKSKDSEATAEAAVSNGWQTLDTCGVGYTLPTDWGYQDPITDPAYKHLTKIGGVNTAQALFESPDGTRIRVGCTRDWARGTILTDHGSAVNGFDEFVKQSHLWVADSGLSSEVDRTPLVLGGGVSVPFTQAHISKGALGGEEFYAGFGATRLQGSYVVISANGDPEGYDRDDVNKLASTIALEK